MNSQRSFRFRRALGALLAAGVLVSGIQPATAAAEQATTQPPLLSQAPQIPSPSHAGFGSLADATPLSAVSPGEPFRSPQRFSGTPVTSELNIPGVDAAGQLLPGGESQWPTETGKLMAETPLDPAIGLNSAGQQIRFAYSTTGAHGLTPSTGALFLPKGTPPQGGWPVLAWAHGTVGLGDKCTPSMNPRSPRDQEYLNHWLEQGYAIVASDYAGQGTPGLMSYLNGQVTAANVVDSVIAAHELTANAPNSDGLGEPALSRSWAVIGQSQGGGAALHVAHEATERSQPAGLDYRGAVATGAPAYIEEIVLAAGPTFPPVPLPAGLNSYSAYIIAAFREAHPEVDVDSALTQEGKALVEATSTACYPELAEAVKGSNVARAFAKPLRDVPGLEPALRDYMQTPTDGYDRPVFLGHGLKDMDVPTPIGMSLNSEMWLRQFLDADGSRNARVDVHWYPTDHSGTVAQSQADSTPFLKSIFS